MTDKTKNGDGRTPDPKAKEQKASSWWETVRTIVYAILLAMVVRTFAYEPFNIPSSSMEPSLLVGDYLFVSKFAYGYSRYSFPFSLPLFEGRVFGRLPERGEVAVFRLPSDNSTDYIKRIVGLPGDTVQVTQGRLFINGEVVPRRPDGVYERERRRTQQVLQRDRFVEILPGGYEHFIIEDNDLYRTDNTPLFEVPEGHYFVMGDNRDASQDSRTSVGFVPLENFVGPASFLFFSLDNNTRFYEIWRWPWAIRYDRLLAGIT